MGLRFVAGLLLLCSWVGVSAQSVAEQYLFQAANAVRAERGIPPLHWDGALYRAALGHAREMAKRENISHQYPGEPELAERGKNAGAQFSMISENVAEAVTAVRIHEAWMNSPGHRANLLDPRVDAVGISVLERNGQLYAVQDFQRSVEALSLEDQERTVGRLVTAASANSVKVLVAPEDARRTCALTKGYAGVRQPMFITRYTSGDIQKIPDTLKTELQSGRYREAVVGACAAAGNQPFSSYSIAVMLYP